jgi:large subunit ribosomal protein L23
MQIAKNVLLKPIISEKTYKMMDEGAYVFVVDPRASKVEIKDSVETAFQVRVRSVNTLNRKGKRKRNKRTPTFGQRSSTKRAIVRLVGEDRIELFET